MIRKVIFSGFVVLMLTVTILALLSEGYILRIRGIDADGNDIGSTWEAESPLSTNTSLNSVPRKDHFPLEVFVKVLEELVQLL